MHLIVLDLIVLDLHYSQALSHNVAVWLVVPLNVQLEVLDILHSSLFQQPWILPLSAPSLVLVCRG
jgi:hypothetical protein